MASIEDVYILKHGFPSVIVSSNKEGRKRVVDSLKGSCKYDGDLEKLLEERLNDYESLD